MNKHLEKEEKTISVSYSVVSNSTEETTPIPLEQHIIGILNTQPEPVRFC